MTCAARGVAGPIAAGARFVRIDRDVADGLAPLADETFDAVVDVSRHPSQVRRAVATLKRPGVHWTFVSTVSVYADNRIPGQRADTAPLREPVSADIEHSTDAIYGAAKVACEQAVGGDAFICRAGLIAGPEDPTGRFAYWPARLARGGPRGARRSVPPRPHRPEGAPVTRVRLDLMISLDGFAFGSHFAAAVMSSFVTFLPSSLRNKFSRRTRSETGKRATSSPAFCSADSR